MQKIALGLLVLPLLYLSCRQKPHTIRSFYVEHNGSEGKCPVYKMGFHQDRTVTYIANCFDSGRARFTATIPPQQFDTLMSLLNATNFSSFNENNNVDRTNRPGTLLTIMYDQNQIKRVKGYGKPETKQLQELYGYIDKLRENQQWKKML